MPVHRVLRLSVLVLASILLQVSARAQLHNFGWVDLQGGKTVASTNCVTSDQHGSSYFGGTMNGVVNFGGVTLTPQGATDTYVGKLNNAGLLVWAAQLGAQVSSQPSAIGLDNAGNLYATGVVTDSFSSHLFVSKYDPKGNELWHWRLFAESASSTISSIGLTVSQSGNNIYVTAASTAGVHYQDINSVERHIASGTYTIRLNSAGAVDWLKTDTATVRALCLDSLENIYLGGVYSFGVTPKIGGIKITPAKSNVAYGLMASYDSAGTIRWAKGLDSLAPSTLCYGNGYLYGSNASSSTTGSVVIALRVTTSGNAVKYLRNSNGGVGRSTVAADGLGHVYMAGNLLANIIIDTVNTTGGSCYIMRMDTALQPRWATSWSGAKLINYTPGIAVDTSRGLVICGTISGITSFGSKQVTPATTNGFVAQLTLQDLSFSIPPQGVICAGDTLYVSVHTQGPFYQGNIFDVQLSDSLGKFASYTHVAQRNASGSTTISGYIPLALHAGTKYRVRVASSSPNITTRDNGSDLTLSAVPISLIIPNGVISLCDGDSLTLAATGGAACLWSTGDTSRTIVVAKTGVYSALVFGTNGCVARPEAANVTMHPIPPIPAVTRAGNTLFSNAFANNQWNRNGTPIAGATKQTFSPTVSGTYSVTVLNEFKCGATSDGVDVQLDESAVRMEASSDIRLVSAGVLKCASLGDAVLHIMISNLLGVTVADFDRSATGGEIDLSQNFRSLPTGVYYLHLQNQDRSFNFRFINLH